MKVLHRLLVELADYVEHIEKWPISTPRWVPVQSNGFDCGMYVIELIRAPHLGQKIRIRVLYFTEFCSMSYSVALQPVPNYNMVMQCFHALVGTYCRYKEGVSTKSCHTC